MGLGKTKIEDNRICELCFGARGVVQAGDIIYECACGASGCKGIFAVCAAHHAHAPGTRGGLSKGPGFRYLRPIGKIFHPQGSQGAA